MACKHTAALVEPPQLRPALYSWMRKQRQVVNRDTNMKWEIRRERFGEDFSSSQWMVTRHRRISLSHLESSSDCNTRAKRQHHYPKQWERSKHEVSNTFFWLLQSKKGNLRERDKENDGRVGGGVIWAERIDQEGKASKRGWKAECKRFPSNRYKRWHLTLRQPLTISVKEEAEPKILLSDIPHTPLWNPLLPWWILLRGVWSRWGSFFLLPSWPFTHTPKAVLWTSWQNAQLTP